MPVALDFDLPGEESLKTTAHWDEGFFQLDRHTGVVRRFTAEATLNKATTRVELEAEVGVEGHRAIPRCIEMRVQRVDSRGRPSQEPITSETLRAIPIARLLSKAMESPHVLFKIGDKPDGSKRVEIPNHPERRRLYERYVVGARKPRRGSPITDSQLKKVANVYRGAVRNGDPPTRTVASVMEVPRSTAARWVSKARERKLLGPAKRGRPGEAKEGEQ